MKGIEEEIAGPDSHPVKEAIEECNKSVKEDSAESDNAAFVNSTPSPRSKSSDRLKEKDSPVPDSDSSAAEELVSPDCQAPKPADGLESLIGTLRHQLRSSDWLEKNTPEMAAGEDPEIRDVFLALMQRARK